MGNENSSTQSETNVDVTSDELKSELEREEKKEHLYVIGGMNGYPIASVFRYDSSTGEWTATTPMPEKRSHFGCAVIDHKIYVCGGWDGQWKYLTPLLKHGQSWGKLELHP